MFDSVLRESTAHLKNDAHSINRNAKLKFD